uniref:Uncharacterized protein LOC100377605 n=1 Tax=Saccoglossus kowalevskii TaxID=10224 RepID=A0ABM0GJ80_SACKO|nr:PREDICTED: uncharacterized protein LOC100377605 [Saccoglossus kowalevskii]
MFFISGYRIISAGNFANIIFPLARRTRPTPLDLGYLRQVNVHQIRSKVLIRRTREDDMQQVSDLTVDVHWDYSVEYLESLRQANPTGFYVAEKEKGVIIGTGYSIIHSNDFAFVGISITKSEHRRQGIQKMMVKTLLEHAGDRNVGLTSQGQYRSEVYSKVGFRHLDINFETMLLRGKVDHSIVSLDNNVTIDIVPFREVSFNNLLQRGSHEIVGYGAVYKMLPGEFSIIPLCGDDGNIANALFQALYCSIPDKSNLRGHFVCNNPKALQLAATYGLQENLMTLRRQYTLKTMSFSLTRVLIRCVRQEDMQQVSDLTVNEHWDFSVEYLESLRQANPTGFYVAEKEKGVIIGSGYSIIHSNDFAFFGLSITKSGHRRQGIQKKDVGDDTRACRRPSHVLIRCARHEDMQQVSDLTIDEHWDFSVEYLESLRQANPTGFYVAEKEKGVIIGAGYSLIHSSDFAFFGLSITKPEYRRQGIQKKMLRTILEHAGDRNVGLTSQDQHRSEVYSKEYIHKLEPGIIQETSSPMPYRLCQEPCQILSWQDLSPDVNQVQNKADVQGKIEKEKNAMRLKRKNIDQLEREKNAMRLQRKNIDQFEKEKNAMRLKSKNIDQLEKEKNAMRIKSKNIDELEKEKNVMRLKRKNIDQLEREKNAVRLKRKNIDQLEKEENAMRLKRKNIDQLENEKNAIRLKRKNIDQLEREKNAMR